ncbi:MAG: hypothetical protein LBD42_02790 [Desulfovibrio sp.]|jgi:hypothetical protein|nr:hypothetical protein [Desulfovibrio sp.]
MRSREKHTYGNSDNELARQSASGGPCQDAYRLGAPSYDPELLYVECHLCGKPVLWERGKTTELLLAAGVDVSSLDERCLIVSEGCPLCSPFAKEGYTLVVVRIAGLTPEEAVHMSRPGGTA